MDDRMLYSIMEQRRRLGADVVRALDAAEAAVRHFGGAPRTEYGAKLLAELETAVKAARKQGAGRFED